MVTWGFLFQVYAWPRFHMKHKNLMKIAKSVISKKKQLSTQYWWWGGDLPFQLYAWPRFYGSSTTYSWKKYLNAKKKKTKSVNGKMLFKIQYWW